MSGFWYALGGICFYPAWWLEALGNWFHKRAFQAEERRELRAALGEDA